MSDGRPTDPDYEAYLREIRVNYSARYCRWTPSALRKSFDLVVRKFTEWGVPPTITSFRAPDVPHRFGSHYATYIRRRKKIEASAFKGVGWWSLEHSTRPFLQQYNREIVCAVAMQPKWSTFGFQYVPALLGVPESELVSFFRDLARYARTPYASRTQNRILYTPMPQQWVYDRGFVPYSKLLSYQLYQNWNCWQNAHLVPGLHLALLKDVRHRMYLGQVYLDAPMGYRGISLRDWILSYRSRGDLRTFTKSLMEWTPPSESIFKLREELYRAGRLYYHKHFLGRDAATRGADEVRWEPHGDLPEIFKAENFRDCDPELSW